MHSVWINPLFRMQVEDTFTFTQLPKRHVIYFLQGEGPGIGGDFCWMQIKMASKHHCFLSPFRYMSFSFKIGQNRKVFQGDHLLVKL